MQKLPSAKIFYMQFGVMLAAHYVFNDVTYAPIITSTMMLLQKQYLDLMTV